jgi:hypothetical protein
MLYHIGHCTTWKSYYFGPKFKHYSLVDQFIYTHIIVLSLLLQVLHRHVEFVPLRPRDRAPLPPDSFLAGGSSDFTSGILKIKKSSSFRKNK